MRARSHSWPWVVGVLVWSMWAPLAAQEEVRAGATETQERAPEAAVPEEAPGVRALGWTARDRAWVAEAQADAGKMSPQVRAESMIYGQAGLDTSVTDVIYEGTVARYPFGHRQAALVCAPLRVCTIMLEEGETVLEVMLGDQEHWQVELLSMGEGGATPVLGVRPMVEFSDSCDKTTNVAVTTDRRFYSVLLEVPPCAEADEEDPNPQRAYHQQLSFYYPDDVLRRWTTRAQLKRQQREAERARPQPTRLEGGAGVADLNFSYRVKRAKKFPWRLQAVFDDGTRTYLRLPPEAREVPSVFEVSAGEDRIVNFNVSRDDPSLLIVSRVAQELVLVLPRGKETARLHLENEGFGR